ncbi:hypothetical protein HUT17_02320 [Nocardiopsis flavescens]|nr:hypothetical protein HUT17_02320 [Nocardiopsis flavescens]
MALILCIIAGALILAVSLRRILEYGADAPRLLTYLAQRNERARSEITALRRIDALLDERDSGTSSTEELDRRVDEELASFRTESEQAAQVIGRRLPRLEALRRLALFADLLFAAIGLALMVGASLLGFSLIG